MALIDVKCENKGCGKAFKARSADRARGWGRFCSKSCKAVKQARTGQYAALLSKNNSWIDDNGNRCHRFSGSGGSLVVCQDAMTGEFSREEFDRHGESRGFQLTREDCLWDD